MDHRHDQFVQGHSQVTVAEPQASRTPALPFVLAAGLAGAVFSWFVPVALYELIVESVGLSELFASFAAPLGLTARLLIAGAAGLVSAVIVAALFMKNPPSSHAPRPRRPRVRANDRGVETMASQAPEARDYRAPAEPNEPASGGWFRKIMANLPAPRRFADDGADKASAARGTAHSDQKRLRPGTGLADDEPRRARPIAAHAELGEPLPPVEPRIARAAVSNAPTIVTGPTLAMGTPLSTGGESIEALTDRLARALGRGSDFAPQPTRRDDHEPRREPEPEPEQPQDDRAAEAAEAKRAELEAARQAARMAVDEAEEAKARAERNVEEAREQARRVVEEAEAAVLRANERAAETRNRLSSLEDEIAAIPQQPVPPAQTPAQSFRTAPRALPPLNLDQPIAEPASADDMDPALRDALRTLRRMTAQQ